jgi:hypothetical protein
MKVDIGISPNKNERKYDRNQQLQDENNIKNKFKSRNSIEIKSVTSELKSSPPSTSELSNQHS